MKTDLPVEFLAEINETARRGEVLLAVLKMPSGNIYFSDDSWGQADGLDFDYLPLVESWGQEQDGGQVESLLNPGNLESKTMRINLVLSDNTKPLIYGIINEGLSNVRLELYNWFPGMVAGPVLHDVFFCQEPIAGREDGMTLGLDLVSAIMSENPKIWERENQNEIFDVVIGKADRIPLKFLEGNPPVATFDEEIDEVFLGIVKVSDVTEFETFGTILANGEYIGFSERSASNITIDARGLFGSTPQRHNRGTKFFPYGAVFAYGICAGPVALLEDLRAGTTVYSGGNETFQPGTNPAKVLFSDRLPWLMEDQNVDIVDKVYYGAFSDFDDPKLCYNVPEINTPTGKAGINIDFRNFSKFSLEKGYLPPLDLYIPSNQAGHRVYKSDNFNNGKFTTSENSGAWEFGLAYTEVRITNLANPGDEAWITAPMADPGENEFYRYTGMVLPKIGFPLVESDHMRFHISIHACDRFGLEILWRQWLNIGSESLPPSVDMFPSWWGYSGPRMNLALAHDWEDMRWKIKIVLAAKGMFYPNPYAYFRIGENILLQDGSSKTFYNMTTEFEYFKYTPSAYILSRFDNDFTEKGDFISAKIRITGKQYNTADKAGGLLEVLENGTVINTDTVIDGTEFVYELPLLAATWEELKDTEIKIQATLNLISGKISAGSAGFELSAGVQWLLTYTGHELDAVQVSYAREVTVSATSVHGANRTPADSVRDFISDYTGYADLVDNTDFDGRAAEYTSAGHFLNGLISGSLDLQGAFRKILFEGFARLKFSQGKIKLLNHITDTSTIKTKDILQHVIKKRGFSLTPEKDIVNRMFFNFNKILKTGIFDGKITKTDGQPAINDKVFTFDLVDSEPAVQLMADWIFLLSSTQRFSIDTENLIYAYEVEKGDIISVLDLTNNDLSTDCKVISVTIIYPSAKNEQLTKYQIKALRA